jgi:hypothetical protein
MSQYISSFSITRTLSHTITLPSCLATTIHHLQTAQPVTCSRSAPPHSVSTCRHSRLGRLTQSLSAAASTTMVTAVGAGISFSSWPSRHYPRTQLIPSQTYVILCPAAYIKHQHVTRQNPTTSTATFTCNDVHTHKYTHREITGYQKESLLTKA